MGKTLAQQGKYSAAMRLQTEAVDGMVVARFWWPDDFRKTFDLLFEALEGMTETYGAEHLRTAKVRKNIARVSCLVGNTVQLEDALLLVNEVIATRKTNGQRSREEEERMRYILPITTRNTGADYGVLFGRQILTMLLVE
ncbi:hypothetical protein F4680DRAFT_449987 [Xylaria scruposa]|nr:hypothetical protein F4680DRAFT_449987 [Xylaria scruposa]